MMTHFGFETFEFKTFEFKTIEFETIEFETFGFESNHHQDKQARRLENEPSIWKISLGRKPFCKTTWKQLGLRHQKFVGLTS